MNTTEKIEEMLAQIEVMRAYENGRQIEIADIGYENWINCFAPVWEWKIYKYRIKETQRSHPEIVSNWFRIPGTNDWEKIKTFSKTSKTYWFDASWRYKDYFNDLEMKTDEEMKRMA
jgi:hypothetical protein